ncbi:MAG: hypothetical protein KGO82_05710 [Bacteroidota bacterium]|nr:hypothetical protein [Bacteroidota bacterium]
MKLYDIAHSRAGDKGNTSTLSLIPYKDSDFEWLCREITADKVSKHLQALVKGTVTRYELPLIASLLFVCEDALDTGVTTSLRVDPHGKTLSSFLLEIEIGDR